MNKNDLEKVIKKTFVYFGTITALVIIYLVVNFIIASIVAFIIGLFQNVPFWHRDFFDPIYRYTNIALFILEGVVIIPALVKSMNNFDK